MGLIKSKLKKNKVISLTNKLNILESEIVVLDFIFYQEGNFKYPKVKTQFENLLIEKNIELQKIKIRIENILIPKDIRRYTFQGSEKTYYDELIIKYNKLKVFDLTLIKEYNNIILIDKENQKELFKNLPSKYMQYLDFLEINTKIELSET